MYVLKSFFKKAFSKYPVILGFISSFMLGSFVIYAYGIGERIIFAPNTVISADSVNQNFKNIYDNIYVGLYASSTLGNSYSVTCIASGCVIDDYLNIVDNIIYTKGVTVSSGIYNVESAGIFTASFLPGYYVEATNGTCDSMRSVSFYVEVDGTLINTGQPFELDTNSVVRIKSNFDLSTSTAYPCDAVFDFSQVSLLLRRIL